MEETSKCFALKAPRREDVPLCTLFAFVCGEWLSVCVGGGECKCFSGSDSSEKWISLVHAATTDGQKLR